MEPVLPGNSQLITVRVWRAPEAAGQDAWRGQVRHVLTGQVRYFRGWAMLVAVLQALLEQPAAGPGAE